MPAPEAASAADRLFARLLAMLPQHALSRCVHRAARWPWRPWKSVLIGAFRRLYAVDLGEAAEPDPAAYPSFNAFFTRALRPGVRPQPATADAVTSPVDGRLSAHGRLEGEQLMQAKGQHYTLTALLGGDPGLAAGLRDGAYATLYLSPRDYHRVHMPCAGRLRRMLHVPGRLFGVSPPLVRAVPELFARNERVVCLFDGARGPFAVVLVGAIGVGSIETVWAGEITPPAAKTLRTWDYGDRGPALARGEELGRFNLGSTVILAFGPGQVRWNAGLRPEAPVRLGETLARISH
ncbi:archaetidylserine decarboxylase [Spiribacter halobius]|nr:archaetidylserine decarboxylase [Spiribacter halobius]UEX78974.1 archaetidylserine decarboxylase [Spiribacter halobius]